MHVVRDIVDDAFSRFLLAAEAAGVHLGPSEITVEHQPAPHRPPSPLRMGQGAVYAFFLHGRCLKCGMVGGTGSNPRYTVQHYDPRGANNTLARFVDANRDLLGVAPEEAAGDWIKRCTHRVNFVVPSSFGLQFLAFLETFLHIRWSPLYEVRTPVPDGHRRRENDLARIL